MGLGYGWVEFGIDGRDRPFVRALDEGGTVWEGEGRYGPSTRPCGRWRRASTSSWRRKASTRDVAGVPRRSQPPHRTRNRSLPRRRRRRPRHPRSETHRVKPEATPPVPRAVVEKVRKFAEIAEALRRGERFEITRLTTLKGLCKDPGAARSFALFLAVHARRRAEEKKAPERVKDLMDRAITEMESYLDDPTKERKERLYDLLREIEGEQNEHKRISWGQVRIVHSMELVVVENALKSVLRDHEAPAWLYQAARDYAERYDPRHGTGLIPASAPMMQEIADFWRDFYGIDG